MRRLGRLGLWLKKNGLHVCTVHLHTRECFEKKQLALGLLMQGFTDFGLYFVRNLWVVV